MKNGLGLLFGFAILFGGSLNAEAQDLEEKARELKEMFDKGDIDETIILEKGKKESVEVPAFTWHTYVMLSQKVIIYETMEGIYDPSSWKRMAPWAPLENSEDSSVYLSTLKNIITY